MSRTFRTWLLFAAALALVLAVMAFLTVRMLQFERTMAAAEARAAVEETIRLALWRMDAAATSLLPRKPRPFRAIANNSWQSSQNYQNTSNNALPQQRTDPEFQQQLNLQELQQRQELNAPIAADWRKIQPALLDRISDILPGATLEPIGNSPAAENDPNRLASIPARLLVPPQAFAAPPLHWNTPLRVSLMIAWACALIAASAVALLLRGALALSERQGAFVAAVTHELRTPLTTFKMYAEMLATGMISQPESRQQYLDTLVGESDRLGHLIENVLAYARLERRSSPDRAQAISLGELLERTLPALHRRARQSNFAMEVTISPEARQMQLRTDPIAVQQILVNLIDNACKYGKGPIRLCIRRLPNGVELQVCDHGPGVSRKAADRLFAAFNKSKSDAIPGIGLGLFLSRRLARDLGGDLSYGASAAGANFVLALPGDWKREETNARTA